MNKKIKFYTYLITLISVIFIFTILECTSIAATPKIVNKIQDAFADIASWLIKLATPAAAVAVGTGVFMKKFSFGDEERIRTAKRIIRGSLFSYGFILCVDLVLALMKTLLS